MQICRFENGNFDREELSYHFSLQRICHGASRLVQYVHVLLVIPAVTTCIAEVVAKAARHPKEKRELHWQ